MSVWGGGRVQEIEKNEAKELGKVGFSTSLKEWHIWSGEVRKEGAAAALEGRKKKRGKKNRQYLLSILIRHSKFLKRLYQVLMHMMVILIVH